MVIVLSFNSDDPSSNSAEVYSFSAKMLFEKNENKHKQTVLARLKNLFM